MRFLRTRIAFDRLGIEFPHKGDTVIWLWPWRRGSGPKFISLGFTGTGECGDARFATLADLDVAWADFEKAMQN